MNYAENTLISKLSKGKRLKRLSVVDIAKNVLGQDLRIEPGGRYLLWQMGRWIRADLYDVMRAANRKLHGEQRPQISLNPAWVVK